MIGLLFGLLLGLLILIVLGFVLAWVTGMIAGAELSVGKAVLILIVNTIVSILLGMVLPSGIAWQLVSIPISVVIFAALIGMLAQVKFLHGLLIAVIFNVVIWVAMFAIGAVMLAIAGAAGATP